MAKSKKFKKLPFYKYTFDPNQEIKIELTDQPLFPFIVIKKENGKDNKA